MKTGSFMAETGILPEENACLQKIYISDGQKTVAFFALSPPSSAKDGTGRKNTGKQVTGTAAYRSFSIKNVRMRPVFVMIEWVTACFRGMSPLPYENGTESMRTGIAE